MKTTKYPWQSLSGHARDFVKELCSLSSEKSRPECFQDFLDLTVGVLSVYDPTADAALRESRKKEFIGKFDALDPGYVAGLTRLTIILDAAHSQPGGDGDFLGRCASALGVLNADMGQFFTPDSVSGVMARIGTSREQLEEVIRKNGFITASDPAAGAGGTLIAHADMMREYGFDPTRDLFVEAVDVNRTAWKMCYIQLSQRGIPARVVHGNSLTLEVFDTLHTSAFGPFCALHAHRRHDGMETVLGSSFVRAGSGEKPDAGGRDVGEPESTVGPVAAE